MNALRPLLAALVPFCLLAGPSTAADTAERDEDLVARLETRAGVRLESARVTLWADRDALPPESLSAFLERLEDGLASVERKVGHAIDVARHGDTRIHVYVSESVGRAHVLGGDEQAPHDRPCLFFPAAQVIEDREPYVRELARLALGYPGSHALREGLVAYIHRTTPRRDRTMNALFGGVRGRAEADRMTATTLRGPLGDALLAAMGANGRPSREILADHRGLYEVATFSFVVFVMGGVDFATMIRLDQERDVESAFAPLTGRSLPEWRTAWLDHLRVGGDRGR